MRRLFWVVLTLLVWVPTTLLWCLFVPLFRALNACSVRAGGDILLWGAFGVVAGPTSALET